MNIYLQAVKCTLHEAGFKVVFVHRGVVYFGGGLSSAEA